MADAEVKLVLDHVKVVIEGATKKALEAIALQMSGQTKINIRDNRQIDTGFMLNSVFVVTPEGTQGETWADGQYRDQAGENVERKKSPASVNLGDAAAAVVVGAEYAIFQEARNSFLFRAAEQTAKAAGGTAEAVFKEYVHD